MADNLNVTPGTGEKLPAKELTHSGETVKAQIVELGIDDGSALMRLQGGRKTAAGSMPIVSSANQVQRLYSKVAFGSVPSSFTTILDPVTATIELDQIEVINNTNSDIEITYGASSSALGYVPAGATKNHPMHLNHELNVADFLRSKGLRDRRTLWQRLTSREKYIFQA